MSLNAKIRHAAASLFLFLTGTGGWSAEGPAPVKMPPQDGAIAGIRLEPPVLRVEAGRSLTFLVTALQADGFETDVTGSTVLTLSDPDKASAGGPGVLLGKVPGALVLAAVHGTHRLEVPVEVVPASGLPVSFVREVLPILGKAGCNAGACHAKADGQNGLRLTIFSFDPQADYRNIVDGARGRRVFPSSPPESLLLLKATQSVPHEGGARLERGSEAWHTLVSWIGSGMTWQNTGEPALASVSVLPPSRRYRKGTVQRLVVQAHYTDGSARDVTALAQFDSNNKETATVSETGRITAGPSTGQAVVVARFMGMVGGSQVLVPEDRLLPAAAYQSLPVHNFIDELSWPHFQQMGLLPSEPCSDAEFLRRASLDTLGMLPTPEAAAAFLADPDPDKRTRASDALLQHPAWADHQAAKWADLLRPNPDRAGVKSVYLLDQWLRDRFRQNKPFDQLVREIVVTQGNTHRYGPAVIYRDRREPEELTTLFSQVFLGVRLDCARCHHHPNEKWSQEDFYRMAAFFGPLTQKGGGISAPISGGNETFFVSASRPLKHPVTREVMQPKPPDGPAPAVAEGQDPRRALADWMLDPSNPFFARAMANRVWASFFGRGLVDPVDDFRLSNPPSHPALLDALAAELVRVKFDGKSLARTILQSRLYQLSSRPNDTNAADTRHFSRSYRRRLGAETMADAIADITGVPTPYPGLPAGSRAVQAWTYKIDSRTMDAFGRPNSSSDCPCERNLKPSIGQALHLMNSEVLQEKLSSMAAAGRVQRLASGTLPPAAIVHELYLACYGRPPDDEELDIATAGFSGEPGGRRQAIEDVLWALLNSAEFVFNH